MLTFLPFPIILLHIISYYFLQICRDGGPGTQLVSEKWGLSWASYLASKNNYIVAEIDGRGTGFQGEVIRGSLFRTLGTVEVTDQLDVIR